MRPCWASWTTLAQSWFRAALAMDIACPQKGKLANTPPLQSSRMPPPYPDLEQPRLRPHRQASKVLRVLSCPAKALAPTEQPDCGSLIPGLLSCGWVTDSLQHCWPQIEWGESPRGINTRTQTFTVLGGVVKVPERCRSLRFPRIPEWERCAPWEVGV